MGSSRLCRGLIISEKTSILHQPRPFIHESNQKQAGNANPQHECPHLWRKPGWLRDTRSSRIWHGRRHSRLLKRKTVFHPPPRKPPTAMLGRWRCRHSPVEARSIHYWAAGPATWTHTLDETPLYKHPCGYTPTPVKWPQPREQILQWSQLELKRLHLTSSSIVIKQARLQTHEI